jgi:hypothetical protein
MQKITMIAITTFWCLCKASKEQFFFKNCLFISFYLIFNLFYLFIFFALLVEKKEFAIISIYLCKMYNGTIKMDHHTRIIKLFLLLIIMYELQILSRESQLKEFLYLY